MKHAIPLIFILLLLPASEFASAQSDHVDILTGSVHIRSGEKSLIVAVDLSGPDRLQDGVVDEIFIFNAATPIAEPIYFEADTATFFIKERRLIVFAREALFDLALTCAVSGNELLKCDDPGGFEKDLNEGAPPAYAVFIRDGIGLARYNNLIETNMADLAYIDLSAESVPGLIKPQLPEFITAKLLMPIDCFSGGPGSTECSIGDLCSVSCGSGYYACCSALFGCRCVED